jgi:hypothetical protein
MRSILSSFAVALVGSSILVVAQQPPAGQPAPPPQPMSFFIASAGSGTGANSAGWPGPTASVRHGVSRGQGRQDVARLPQCRGSSGQPAVNARDRIGADSTRQGRALAVGDLHGDTLEQARANISKATALTEKGDPINGVGDTPNRHDMITGSQLDGTAFTDGADHTCGNYTNAGAGTVQLGHHDRTGGGNTSWNSTHPSRGCSQENLVATGGAGLFYCFAQ